MATLEIDQSGKWETSGNTVIGVAGGGEPFSVLISNGAKNRINGFLGNFKQERNRSKKMKIIRMFTYSVFLAVKLVVRKGDYLLIDNEYDGNQAVIRDVLVNLFSRFTEIPLDNDNIGFGNVGKHSLAHAVANQTYSGIRRPDAVLDFQDYFRLLDRTAQIREKAFQERIERKKG